MPRSSAVTLWLRQTALDNSADLEKYFVAGMGAPESAVETGTNRDTPISFRIGVVDDHPIYRTGLASALGQRGELEVCWGVATPAEAIRMFERTPVDLVMMDLHLGTHDAIAAIRELASRVPAPKILLMSGLEDSALVSAAMRAGGSAFIAKDSELEEMLVVIRNLHRGRARGAHSRGASRGARGTRLAITEERRLSRREAEVLAEIRLGHTNRDIARSLGISTNTVNKHVQRVLKKLGARNRAQAAVSS
jgi:DNA-binding NarL/FixJ family response regulator